MIFETGSYFVDLVKSNDIKEILGIYNSNAKFLMNHMDNDKITDQWLIDELKSMDNMGFESYKVVEKNTEKIVGIIDSKIGEETYLSLLMLHTDCQGNSLGCLIYEGFEEYIKTLGSKYIKIDVVVNYDVEIINFWIKRGFEKCKGIVLDWNGKELPAITMKKKF